MFRPRWAAWFCTVSIFSIMVSSITVLSIVASSTAAITDSQQKRVDRLNRYIANGAAFYKKKQFDEASEELKRAYKLLTVLQKDADSSLLEVLVTPQKRLKKAGQLLAKQGHEIPDLLALSDSVSTEVASFTKQVAGVLVSRCASCHVRDDKGGFSMESYATLMEGSENGPVIGKTLADSTLIRSVESGDMPPKGDPVPKEEIEILRNWVRQGANFDGEDESARLTSFASEDRSASRANSRSADRPPRGERSPARGGARTGRGGPDGQGPSGQGPPGGRPPRGDGAGDGSSESRAKRKPRPKRPDFED